MNRAVAIAVVLLSALPSARAAAPGDTLALRNQHLLRQFRYDGHTWRTTRIARPDNSASLPTQSDELLITTTGGAAVTLDAYHATADPALATDPATGQQSLTIPYALTAAATSPGPVPTDLTIRYSLSPTGYLRKTITLTVPATAAAIDRLEVERLSIPTDLHASRGGRGEPVFVTTADRSVFFLGIEYPAAYSRHTDGNTPAHGTGPYDKAGNYSFIDLDGHDVDPHPRPGLIRLFHFPTPHGSVITSKTAVIGIGRPGDTPELAFKDYLDTVKRPTRSFLHYNNWYDPNGKKLTPDNFVTHTFVAFKEHLQPYGVALDAMVPDDGWQDRQSVYEPNPAQFPRGLPDMAALSAALQEQGTHLGLWIALNGYNSDIDWGVAHGYTEAVRNERFKKFKRYYSLTDPTYFATISQRLTDLIDTCHVRYFKHDFNEMCDLSAVGHLPTDRHGHEASVDAELALLRLERDLDPDVYQNVTNWIWFSPWWLQHTNNLWMLSSDTGEFTGVPEPSALVRAAAYRDVHLYTLYHDPATRPLVPVSSLMTHGIIYTKTKYANAHDSARDFADYVMMYYTRGTQLKEWYIDPHLLSGDQWQSLARATCWSNENLQTLANAVKVGGDPAKAQPHGYLAWDADAAHAVLTLRNPSPDDAVASVPFDQTVWYRGPAGKPFHARVIYPYQADLPATFTSGHPITLTVPAYTLLTLDITPGPAPSTAPTISAPPPAITRTDNQIRFTLPDEDMQRADLLLISTNPPPPGAKAPDLPRLKLNDQPVQPTRTAVAPAWSLACFDLRRHKGQPLTVELLTPDTQAHLLLDRPAPDAAPDTDPRLPMPVAQGYRRQAVPLTDRDARPVR